MIRVGTVGREKTAKAKYVQQSKANGGNRQAWLLHWIESEDLLLDILYSRDEETEATASSFSTVSSLFLDVTDTPLEAESPTRGEKSD